MVRCDSVVSSPPWYTSTPHSVDPEQQKKNGASIARFLESNFIDSAHILSEIKKSDRAMQIGNLLSSEENSRILASSVAESLRQLVRKGVHLDLMSWIIPIVRRYRTDIKDVIQITVANFTGRYVPDVVDRYFTNKVAEEIERILDQLETPGSDESSKLDSWFRIRFENIPDDWRGPLARAASEIKNYEVFAKLGNEAPSEDLVNAIADLIIKAGEWIKTPLERRNQINRVIEDTVLQYIPPFREKIGAYIEKTVRDWDAKTVTVALENQVGKDLQFIRINGTVVGALAGIALFIGAELVAKFHY